MKKIFFSKYTSSHGGEQRQNSPARRDKKQSTHMQQKKVGSGSVVNKFQNSEHFVPDCERKVTEKKKLSRTRSLVLRRSQSFQMLSATDNNNKFTEQDLPESRDWKNVSSSHSRCASSDFDYQFTNCDSTRPERYNVATIQIPHAEVLRDRACSCPSNSSSPRSSSGSTSIPGRVLDLYVDGEHHQESKLRKSDRYHRGSKENSLFHPSDGASRDYFLKSKNEHESPRKLAKDVVERLLRLEQTCDSQKHRYICSHESNRAPMPTIASDKHLDGRSYAPPADTSPEASPHEHILDKHLDGQSFTLLPEDEEDPTDLALRRKLMEVKEKVRLVSGQLSQGRSFPYYSGDISALCQRVRNLVEEEQNLMLEIYDQLQCRISERVAAKNAATLLKEEMNSAIVKLEREKDEVKARLENELERRSTEWEIKLREFQSEEHRLRDRIRELAEQNVSLQREVSGYYNKEKEYTDRISQMEVYLKDIIDEMDEAKAKNEDLQRKLSEIQDKLEVAGQVQSSMESSYKKKEREFMDTIKVVAKLRGTNSDQERTIDGLRRCLNSENYTSKLQMEQLRLTGVEQDLRRQLETCSAEANSLRSENIYLLERLKNLGNVGGSSSIKLEQELVSYVQCLQNTGLSLLNECIQISENVIGILERKTTSEEFMESHSVIQYGVKIQGFRKGLEQLTRSLGKTAFVLKEKTELGSSELDVSDAADRKNSEDDLKSELKAERLLTSILKEKMYSKEKEVERMQVELAGALRSHDVLKREIQEAADTVSCVNHKLKNLELQMIQKDGTINELQGDIRSYDEQLTSTRGTLSKVTQERDFMWQEVKQYSEKNMLLNREVESLKKKVEALEEDTLLKDGQISILKDSLNNAKPFILFDSEQLSDF